MMKIILLMMMMMMIILLLVANRRVTDRRLLWSECTTDLVLWLICQYFESTIIKLPSYSRIKAVEALNLCDSRVFQMHFGKQGRHHIMTVVFELEYSIACCKQVHWSLIYILRWSKPWSSIGWLLPTPNSMTIIKILHILICSKK